MASFMWFVAICRSLNWDFHQRSQSSPDGFIDKASWTLSNLMAEFQGESGKQKLTVLLNPGHRNSRKSHSLVKAVTTSTRFKVWGSNPAVNGRVPHSLCEKRTDGSHRWKLFTTRAYIKNAKNEAKSVSTCWYNYAESRLPRWLSELRIHLQCRRCRLSGPWWVAMPSSRGSSWPRDWTCVSYVSCIGG